MLKKRVLSAVILVAVIGTGLVFGGLLWWALLLFISIMGFHEYCRAVRRIPAGESYEIDAPELMGYLCTAVYYIVIYAKQDPGFMIYTLAGSVILFMVVYVIAFPKYGSDMVTTIYFGFLYVPFLISFLYLLRIRDRGLIEVLLVFISAWICDTFAYFTGVAFGRHKLAPVLSPKKSIEGSVGGVSGAALFGALLAVIAHESIVMYAGFAGAGAVISQFGDLFASGIKRDRGIKDYGNMIPGHGGILDRFDSLMITAPVMYILCMILL